MLSNTFRSLRVRNYRIWAAGSLVSNIGTWMQRIAQDWLVLAQLTNHSAVAVGIVSACQYAPQLLFLPWTGSVADRIDRRRLLMATQTAMGTIAFLLGLLIVTGVVRLWHVYVCAAISGCIAAFDAPAGQAFVADLVGDEDLPNAVALNSTSFNSARLIGPAVAGVAIAAVGSGWAFMANAGTFIAVLCALLFLRGEELHRLERADVPASGLVDGFHYVLARPQLLIVLVMLFVVGTFGFNFPIFISTMSITVFHQGAGRFGLLTSAMALGSVVGALATTSATPSTRLLIASAVGFGLGFALAACAPSYWWFATSLTLVGMMGVFFSTMTNSFMQLETDPAMRGRVLSIRLAVAVGTTPLGAPLVGWIADGLGPRWGVATGAASGFAAAAVAIVYVSRNGGLENRTTRAEANFRKASTAKPALFATTAMPPRGEPRQKT